MTTRNRTQTRATLATLTVLVWGTAIANSTYKIKLAAKTQVSVTLTTKPDAVKISLDGERLEDGAYIVTPTKFPLPPGRHKLKIARDGYVAHVITVEKDSGEQFKIDDVVLQKNPDLTFASLTVDGYDAPIYVEIDDGLVRGDTPLATADVTLGTEHTLTVFPRGRENPDVKWKCRFTPKGEADGAEYGIKLRTKGDLVKAANCDKKK